MEEQQGQLTVPKKYRDALELKPGALVAVIRVGTGLLLVPEQARFRELCESIEAVFMGANIPEAEILGTLPEARDRVYRRLYVDNADAALDL